MQKDEDFGTDADDSKNKEYCHYCFKDGKFIDEGVTMEQKIKKSIMVAKSMGMPRKKKQESRQIASFQSSRDGRSKYLSSKIILLIMASSET